MLYCTIAPLAYTAYYLCLRGVSDKHDSAWITCVQASVGMIVFGAYLAWQASQGRRALPPWKELLTLMIIGLITQVGGALMVWAMGVVGVGATTTLQMGVMLGGSAILGLIVLGERVSWPQIAAMVLFVVAVIFFSRGAKSAPAPDLPPAQAAGAARVALGIAAGILSGAAFAVLIVGVRKTVTSATSPEAIVFLISFAGVLFLGPWSVYRLGLETLMHTPPRHLGMMLAAGAMNLIGFLLVTKSLQLVSVVRVNVINNALSMTLTVIAGIVLFAEPWNRDLGCGIVLSIVGVLLISLAGPAKGDAETAG